MATIRPNPAGRAKVLQSDEMADAVEKLAETVADNVRPQGVRVEGIPGDIEMPVKVTMTTTDDMRTDRVKAWVSMAHPSGLATQAKNGTLTKAASAAGLEVKGD
jgi:hypothetical protein